MYKTTAELNSELCHHGILGMQWGKRNGPPYPLSAGDHSTAEKKAGYQKSIDKGSSGSNKEPKGLSDNQKKAMKIGATVVGAAVVAAGVAYAAKKFDMKVNSALTDKYLKTGKEYLQSEANFIMNEAKKQEERAKKEISKWNFEEARRLKESARSKVSDASGARKEGKTLVEAVNNSRSKDLFSKEERRKMAKDIITKKDEYHYSKMTDKEIDDALKRYYTNLRTGRTKRS